MSQRDGYEHGVPSWIAGAHPEPAEAAAFYTELFGWQADTRGDHLVCTLRGRDVAGFVQGDDAGLATNIWVESADETAERATEAGGSLVTAPSTSPASAAPPSSPTPPAPCSPSPSPTPTAALRSSTSRARGR